MYHGSGADMLAGRKRHRQEDGGSNNNHDTAPDEDEERLMQQQVAGGMNDDDDDADDDYDFLLTFEEIARRNAERKRQERQKRLAQLRDQTSSSSSAPTCSSRPAMKEVVKDPHPLPQISQSGVTTGPENGEPIKSTTTNLIGDQVGRIPPPPPPPLPPNTREVAGGDKDDDDGYSDDDDDGFDMFNPTASVSPVNVLSNGKTTRNDFVDSRSAPASATTGQPQQHHHQEDCDDDEGYYKATIGEIITLEQQNLSKVDASNNNDHNNNNNIQLQVLGVIGKGVFSTVLKCQVIQLTTTPQPQQTSSSSSFVAVDDAKDNHSYGQQQQQTQQRQFPKLPDIVAVKCIRHNETMAKAAWQEIQILQKLLALPSNNSNNAKNGGGSGGEQHSGIVSLLLPKPDQQLGLEHRGHVLLVFDYCEYNLRTVLHKFGRGIGLSLTAIQSYFAQLLSALHHLQGKGVLHCDIKPDNILTTSDFGRVQLADFGSAVMVKDQSSIPTPYLVSRYYRAPEIILGLTPLTHGIDLWSLAVTITELFTGSVLFQGRSNNEMIQVMQQVLRTVFPHRIIRQHLRECDKHQLPRHFVQQGTTLMFQQQSIDPVTQQAYSKHIHLHNLLSLNQSASSSLHDVLYKAAGKQRGNVGQLADLLQKCLALDPTKRIDLRSALKHPFFAVGERTKHTTG